MSSHHNIDAQFYQLIQLLQQFLEVLLRVGVALAITKVLNAFYATFVAGVLNAEHFCPVSSIKDKGLAACRVLQYIVRCFKYVLPLFWCIKPCHIHCLGASFRVAEYWRREAACNSAFSYPFGAIKHNLLGSVDNPIGNIHVSSLSDLNIVMLNQAATIKFLSTFQSILKSLFHNSLFNPYESCRKLIYSIIINLYRFTLAVADAYL